MYRFIKNKLKLVLITLLPKRYIIWRGRKSCNKIALTFDDGPHPEYTAQVLNVLKKYGVKATFFIVGKTAQKYPELVERISREGHEIGNHTYSHQTFRNIKLKDITEEIKLTQEVIKDITGKRPFLLRFPHGEWNPLSLFHALRYLISEKLTLVFWSIDPHDYCASDPKNILEKIFKFPSFGGEIFLLHDKNEHSCKALTNIIEALRKNSLEFATVSELVNL